MDKFLQHFKNNLEGQPLPAYDADDWKAMQQKLETQQLGPALYHQKIWWALAAVLLISLLSNWVIFGELRKANEKINLLTNQKDTIIQKEVIYKTDVIYQTSKYNEQGGFSAAGKSATTKNYSENSPIFFSKKPASFFRKPATLQPPSLLDQLSNTNGFHSTYGFSTNAHRNHQSLEGKTNNGLLEQLNNSSRFHSTYGLSTNAHRNHQNLEGKTNNSLLANNSSGFHSTYDLSTNALRGNQNLEHKTGNPQKETVTEKWGSTPAQKLSPRSGGIIQATPPGLPILNTKPVNIRKKKTFLQSLSLLRPKGWEIGGQFGGAYLLGVEEGESWNYGLSANILFSDNLQFWLNGQLQSVLFETQSFDENYGVPIINSPTNDFELYEIKINRKTWQADIGAQYFFNIRQKFKPYVGVGIGRASIFKNKVKYEFEHEILNEEWEEERTFMNLSRNFGIFKTGLSYQIVQNWSSRLEGVYHFNINSPDRQIPDNIGWRAGIFYAF